MMKKVLKKISGSDEGNVSPPNNSDTQENSTSDPATLSLSNNTSSSPCSKKRTRSSTNSETEDLKRPNQNDSFLLELDNAPSDLENSALINDADVTPSVFSNTTNRARGSDSSIFDQLEMPFDENTPFWVPILLQSFDSLKKEIHSNVCALSDEVKSINIKFDTFCSDISSRISILEDKSSSSDAQVAALDEKLKSSGENFILLSSKLENLKTNGERDTNSLKSELEAIKAKNVDLEKSAQFTSNTFDEMKNKIELLSSSNANLLKSVDIMASQLDANEQHNRNECLLLHGVPESAKEMPIQSTKLFVENLNHHLKVGMETGQIRRVRRLGKKRANGKPRPLIARFWSSDLRNHLYYRKKELKNSGISITENLTKKRMILKTEAEAKYGSANVWTKEGRIYAKGTNDAIIPIII